MYLRYGSTRLCYGFFGTMVNTFSCQIKSEAFQIVSDGFPWFANIVYGLMYMYGCQWLSWLDGNRHVFICGIFFVAVRTFFGVWMLYCQKIVS